MGEMHNNPEHIKILEQWMKSYKPEELFDDNGRFKPEYAELAPRGIRVNAVSPGPISTRFHSKMGLTDAQLREAAAGIEASVPMHRFGEPSEVARVAIFLASSDSSYMTGAETVVDGGLSQL